MELYTALEKTLKGEPQFVSEDGTLKKWVIIDRAQDGDPDLINLLLNSTEVKSRFFTPIQDTLVFKQTDFIQFIEQKNYLNSSYTRYHKKVGLHINGKFLKQRNDIALVWPFKDCILEGGQSREEKGREEIFFNDILAQDEITQLLEPKVLTEAKRVSQKGILDITSFNRNDQGIISDSLLIKGNNLLSLHSIKGAFTGKVKLIYIDPPYNRDADAFYNDDFKNSTWLTFMKNRLEVAWQLLRADGFFFIQIDDYQLAYLTILCDEVFGRENSVNIIAVKMSEASGVKMAHVDKKLPKLKEFILSYKKSSQSRLNPVKIKKESTGNKLQDYLRYYTKIIENFEEPVDRWIITPVKEYMEKLGRSTDSESVKAFQLEQANRVIYRTNNSSFEGLNIREPLALVESKQGLKYIWWEGKQMLFLSDYIDEYLGDFWTDISTINLNKEGAVNLANGKKPEKLIKRIISMTTAPGDIVLDYHLGSGTTAAVALKMGRQFIGMEQLDYSENDSLKRLTNVVKGDPSGISADEDVQWKGGGSFIYLELKKYNQAFVEQIQQAKNSDELLATWVQMKKHSFLNYNIDLSRQEESIGSFKVLPLPHQKQQLIDLLDKNQLYMNLSSLKDGDFALTDAEILLNQDFHKLKV